MFPIFDATGARIPLTWDTTYVLNSPGAHDDLIEVDGFAVRDVFAGSIEPYSDRNGFEAYRAHHVSKIIRVTGTIRKTTVPAALAAFNVLAGRFDPNTLYYTDPTSSGFRSMTWVQDSETHLYQARPLQTPDLLHNIYQGSNVPFTIDLLAQPYRTVGSVAGTVSSGGTITNNGDAVGYPTATVTLSTTGPTAFTLTNSLESGKTLTLNLSAYTSGTIEIDFEDRAVRRNGSPIDGVVTAAGWWGLRPGSNVITMTGLTSATFTRAASYWSK